MKSFMEKPAAFLWRDFVDDSSYKLAFLMQFLGIFFSTAMFFFISKLLGDAGASYLKPYGGNYFSFVLLGVAFYGYLGLSVRSLAETVREGQEMGTLEALLVTQTEVPTIIISSSLYSFIWASARVAVYLLIGVLVFGVDLGNANIAGALLLLLLTIISLGGLGMISASFIMVLKKGDPVGWIFTSISGLLGGLYYPVSVLPDWLQNFSYLLPVTYALEGMRLALLSGYSLGGLLPYIAALTIFSVIMLPLGIFAFQYAVRKAKRDGTLTQY
ncbi:MAG: ABC transporter permease [Nitrospiraceae bacterium]|nr:MAG: ABC transporter permease [Nitrospiraceae bacterium]